MRVPPFSKVNKETNRFIHTQADAAGDIPESKPPRVLRPVKSL